jgi:hypothetical protein
MRFIIMDGHKCVEQSRLLKRFPVGWNLEIVLGIRAVIAICLSMKKP